MNLLEAIITIAYATAFGGFVYRSAWFTLEGISKYAVVGLYTLHVALAMGYGLFHQELYHGGDTFNMYRTGVDMATLLKDDPIAYIQALIGPIGQGIPERLLAYPDALDYWQHYSSYSIVRLHALLHWISLGGGYYTHAVFLGFILFWGYTLLLKSLHTYRQGSIIWKAIFLLGTPTVLFFGNGFHKESIVVLALSILFASLLQDRLKLSWQSISWVSAAFVVIFFVKEFYFVALFIPWMVYALSQYLPKWSYLKSTLLNLLIWIIIGWASWYWWDIGIWHRLEIKQAWFLALQGDSNTFQYAFHSIADLPRVIGQGLINALLLPAPSQWQNGFLVLYGVENYLVLGFTFYSIWMRPIDAKDKHRLVLLLSFFLISIIIIGIVVPNLGAIARYKAPALYGLVFALALLWFPKK